MSTLTKGKLKLLTASFIFGTVGLLIKYLGLPSTIVSWVRPLFGVLVLVGVKHAKHQRVNWKRVKENIIPLLIAGFSISINWILLYESYNFTTIAISSVCNYLAPLFVMLLAPLVLKEKLTLKKVICIFIAFLGLIFVTGIFSSGDVGADSFRGVFMATMAACFFATLIFSNKKLHDIDVYDRTIVQFIIIIILLGFYNLFTVDFKSLEITPLAIILLVVAGIVHTGIAYIFYFGSIATLPVTTVSILSYTEPVVCVIVSVFILGESADLLSWIGCALIIGAAFACEVELPLKKKN